MRAGEERLKDNRKVFNTANLVPSTKYVILSMYC